MKLAWAKYTKEIRFILHLKMLKIYGGVLAKGSHKKSSSLNDGHNMPIFTNFCTIFIWMKHEYIFC